MGLAVGEIGHNIKGEELHPPSDVANPVAFNINLLRLLNPGVDDWVHQRLQAYDGTTAEGGGQRALQVAVRLVLEEREERGKGSALRHGLRRQIVRRFADWLADAIDVIDGLRIGKADEVGAVSNDVSVLFVHAVLVDILASSDQNVVNSIPVGEPRKKRTRDLVESLLEIVVRKERYERGDDNEGSILTEEG